MTPANEDVGEHDSRTAYQKKTGRLTPNTSALDPFMVRAALPSHEAVKKYDLYLKDHAKRLRQLEKLAAGELTPSAGSY